MLTLIYSIGQRGIKFSSYITVASHCIHFTKLSAPLATKFSEDRTLDGASVKCTDHCLFVSTNLDQSHKNQRD